MKKLELKISEIKEVCDKKREIHNKMLNAGLENIDFIDDNGNIVEIEKQNIDDYKYTGLNLIDFIDSDFYKNGFENLNSKRYIAKKDTWFKEGTECKLLEDYKEAGGLYRGIYIVGENKGYDTFWHNKGYKEGDEVEMNEVCSHDEFNVC